MRYINSLLQAVLAEAHTKLEEAEARMREEKDHFEAALQEERERKMLAESNLAKEQMKREETSEKEKQWNSTEQGKKISPGLLGTTAVISALI